MESHPDNQSLVLMPTEMIPPRLQESRSLASVHTHVGSLGAKIAVAQPSASTAEGRLIAKSAADLHSVLMVFTNHVVKTVAALRYATMVKLGRFV